MHVQLHHFFDGDETAFFANLYCQHVEECPNGSLPAAAPGGMDFMRPEEVIQKTAQSPNFELSLVAKEAYQKLMAGVKAGCKIYEVLFQELLDAVEHYREEITEPVDAVPCLFCSLLEGLQSLPVLNMTS